MNFFRGLCKPGSRGVVKMRKVVHKLPKVHLFLRLKRQCFYEASIEGVALLDINVPGKGFSSSRSGVNYASLTLSETHCK
jgi:hypothetical protein